MTTLKAKCLAPDGVGDGLVANEQRAVAEGTAPVGGRDRRRRCPTIEGRLNGFFKDVVLLDQPSVSDNKKTVKALLDDAGVTVTRFARFEVGQA